MLHSLPIDNQTNSLQVGNSEKGMPILAPSLELATSSNLPTRPKALDLFSGTGSVGDRLRELGYDVVSLDIDPNRRPTIVTNVLAWEYAKDFSPGYFSVIAAGVPCNEYSPAKTIGHRKLDYADKLVQKTIEIINFFQPPIWWIENPRLGLLKTREVMRGIPYIDVDYCQFGDWGYQKPTRIWCCDTLSKLPNRLCDGISCPNLQPNSKKHKFCLGGYKMKHTTLSKGRMPAKLVDYLLQIPPIIRQVQVTQGCLDSAETFSVGKLSKSGPELQLAMLLKVRTTQGVVKTLKALIDTGAEANLIRQGVLDFSHFENAQEPIQLVTANGQRLMGGVRTISLEIEFNPNENGKFLDEKMNFEATCYEADISIDLILSFPWMAKHKIGVFPHHKALVVDEPDFCSFLGKRVRPVTKIKMSHDKYAK